MFNGLQKNKALFFYPVALFILNMVTKALFLTSEDIGLDEPFSIYHAQFDPGTIISQLKNYNNPPLFELLLHYWIKLFGISPTSVRIFPLIFASLAPIALFYFGKRFFSVQTGIVSSLLLSASSLLFYYAHDCRVYALFLLLGILSMYFFMALLEEKTKPATPVLFVLTNSLLLYAHYFGAFILFFQGSYLLFFYRHRLLKFFGYYLLVLLLYLPHVYILLTRMSQSVAHGTWLKPPTGLESLYNMLWAFSNAPVVTVICAVILLSALVKFIISRQGSINKKTVFILLWFLFPYLGMFLLSYKVPMYISRYLMFVLPAYYILFVVCIQFLTGNAIVKNTLYTLLVIGFALSTDLNPSKNQYLSRSISLIKSIKDEGTLVLAAPYDVLPAFSYHYSPSVFSEVSDQQEYRLTDSLLKADHVYLLNSIPEQDYPAFSTFKKIIYFGNGEAYNDPGNPILKKLAQEYDQFYIKQYSTKYSVRIFLRRK